MSPAKQKLIELEATGNFLFHGSGRELEVVEPKQDYISTNGIDEEDGDPAVFATPYIDYAIMLALVNEENCLDGFRAKAETDKLDNGSIVLKLQMSEETSAQLEPEDFGFVYVLDKKQFNEKWPEEWTSCERCKPIDKILVTTEDLSDRIEII